MTTSKKWLCIKDVKSFLANYSSGKTYKSIITSLPTNSMVEYIIDDNGCPNYVDPINLLEYFRQVPRNKHWKRNKNEDKIEMSP